MPEIGQTFSHFRIVEKIGEGGMGKVFLAEDLTLDRKVALKFLPEAFTSDPERMARFEREAKLLASLNHPNIAGIHGLEQADGNRFLVLEYVEGETLQARQSKGALPLEDALALCRQIAEGLAAAHEKGVIHRDLKPANVMITAEERVKILDFGLAKAFSDETQSIDSSQSPTLTEAMTRPGVILGTAAYMSPEQAKGKSVDKRADIWAFGCILYECLTGRKAFEGETVTEMLAAVLRGEPDWNALPATTPPNIRFVLHRCLDKDMGRRLRDAADVRVIMEEASGFVETPVAVKRSWLAWVIAAVLLVVLAPVAFLHLREKPPPASPPVRFTIPLPEKMSFTNRGQFALSPDGQWLVFSAADANNVDRFWLRAMKSLEVRPLPHTDGPKIYPSVFWSPDSKMIAFEAEGKLKKVDIVGGALLTICEVPGGVYGGSWNREDVIIFGNAQGGLMRVSAQGGSAFPLTVLDSSLQETWHRYPTFLPDGKHFLYVRRSAEKRGLYLGSLNDKPSAQGMQLLTDASNPAYVPTVGTDKGLLLFVRQQILLAQAFDCQQLVLSGDPVQIAEHVGITGSYSQFSASANGALIYRGGQGQSFQLTWFDRRGTVLGTVDEPGAADFNNELSPDGTRLVVSRGEDLWIHDFLRDMEDRLTSGKGANVAPVWSPDSSRIIFASMRNGRDTGIYEKPANGVKEEELLLESSELLLPSSWSSDGRFLLYSEENRNTKSDLWALPLEGDRKPISVLRTEFNEGDGQFSPDMQWVAYVSDESGSGEVYVRGFSRNAGSLSKAGGRWRISNRGGYSPRWRVDGRELFYLAADGKVMAVDVSGGTAFHRGMPKTLFPYQAIPYMAPGSSFLSVTADGNRFLLPVVSGAENSPSPFNVILNWTALLKK
jgi:serine/threonine protein kinase/Tol biopolymer transport system component